MTIVVVVTAGRQPRSFRWGIRPGVNRPNSLDLSRAAERVFGPLTWIDAAVVQVARVRAEGERRAASA